MKDAATPSKDTPQSSGGWLVPAAVGVFIGLLGGALLGGYWMWSEGAAAPPSSETAAVDAEEALDPETGLTPEELAGAQEIQWRLELTEAREALAQKAARIDELTQHLQQGAATGLLWGAEAVAAEPGGFFPMRIEWLPFLNVNAQMLRRVDPRGTHWSQLSEQDRTLMLVEQLFLLQPDEIERLQSELAQAQQRIQQLEIDQMAVVEQSDRRVTIRVEPFTQAGGLVRAEMRFNIAEIIGEARMQYVWPILESSVQEAFSRFGAVRRTIVIEESGRAHARYKIQEHKDFLGRGTGQSTRFQDTLPRQYAHLFELDPNTATP
ncbi:MAG: hypothetical protein ACFB20_00065 [Opitutales bacterium]